MASMKEKFAKGELVLCMNLRLARTVDIAMVAKAGGYDALYVDMQHAYSAETTSTICRRRDGITRWCGCRRDGQWMARVLTAARWGDVTCRNRRGHGRWSPAASAAGPALGDGARPPLGYQAIPLSGPNPRLNAETAVIVISRPPRDERRRVRRR